MSWWSEGWQKPYQVLHWSYQNAWCQGLYWHRQGAPLVILLHGMMANSHWWRGIAGHLADDYAVLALDFSGMGQSEWRDSYDFSMHVQEALRAWQALEHEQLFTVGHSYGGYVGLALCQQEPRIQAHMLLDSPLSRLHHVIRQQSRLGLMARVVYYPDYATIRQHFRLVPEQPNPDVALCDDLVAHSVKETDKGWRWCFDPKTLAQLHHWQLPKEALKGRFYYLAGEQSAFYDVRDAAWAKEHGWHYQVLPQAYHAMILDQPQAVYQCIHQMIKEVSG